MFGQLSTLGNQNRILYGNLTINGLSGLSGLTLVGATGSFGALGIVDGHAGSKQYLITCGYAGTGIFGIVDVGTGTTRLQLNSNGTWTFNSTVLAVPTVIINGSVNNYATIIQGAVSTGQSLGLSILAGTNTADQAVQVASANSGAVFLTIRGDGLMTAPSTIPANNIASVMTCYSAFKPATTNRGAIGLTADPDLQVHINETGWYRFDAYIAFGAPSTSTGGITFNWGGGGGASFAALPNSSYDGFTSVFGTPASLAASVQAYNTTQTYATISVTGGQGDFMMLTGVINITTTGLFSFNWAQNTSQAGGTSVFAGSRMMLQKIG